MTRGKNRYRNAFIVVLLLVVLSSCIFIGITFAWLSKEYNRTSDINGNNSLVLGEVDVRLYSSGTEITSDNATTQLRITTGAVDRTLNYNMRNMGNVDALVRITFTIYRLDENGYKVPALLTTGNPADFANGASSIKINQTDFILQLPNNNVASGYMFYNKRLHPFKRKTVSGSTINETTISANAITIINSLKFTDSAKNIQHYIDIKIDAIAYTGNIYKKTRDNGGNIPLEDPTTLPVIAYPFGDYSALPSGWTAY